MGYYGNLELKTKTRNLRSKGHSYTYIANIL